MNLKRLSNIIFRYAAAAALLLFSYSGLGIYGQAPSPVQTWNGWRVGEKLSYNVAIDKFQNVAFLETYVVSAGKLGGRDVIELRGRVKTFDFVSATIALIDESRTVFTDPDSVTPLYMTRTLNDGALPREVSSNFLTAPAAGSDLLSLIFKIRQAGGVGTFTLFENGDTSVLTATSKKSERIKTEAGEFDTTISIIQGNYFTGLRIKEVVVNFSTDDQHVPVLIRLKTQNGLYRAELRGVQIIKPELPRADPTPTPVVSATQTPRPIPTPVPQRTPEPYVDNVPLLPELSFQLGETLEYKISSAGRPLAALRFVAKERKQFQTRDSLKLVATITGTEQGNSIFALGDEISAQVNPETLAPFRTDSRFAGIAPLSQTMIVDPRTGMISTGTPGGVEAPVGTHSILSLIYAMRSFNLNPSKDPNNPVNDTRVAVFWRQRAYIFTLRPGKEELITLGDRKVPAQLVTIKADVAELDLLAIKVWLSMDGSRVPLRISAGAYQADLTTASRTPNN